MTDPLRDDPLATAPDLGRLVVVPMTLREANAYVAAHHRHSKPVRGSKFALGAAIGDDLVGVAIVGRPVGRYQDDGWTLEVTRNTTTGHRNACSFLYGASWRAARALGYRRLITYILASEDGTSAKAAGFNVVGEVPRRDWDRPLRPRDPDHHEAQARFRLELIA